MSATAMPDTDALTEEVLGFTQILIQARSVTPDDAGCQNLIAAQLEALGFDCEFINAGPVTNLWASKTYGPGPHMILAGHTDVVPTGPVDEWQSDPFEPSIRDGYLFGRGAADMKASLAAMLSAVRYAELSAGTVSFLITSDEEGEAIHGTKHVVRVLADRGLTPDYCIVGEPSSKDSLGDVIRCGRRGSLNCELTVNGVQGHVAYPNDASNPIHLALQALNELTTTVWDEGNEYFPPTSFQISNIHAGTGATNVIPGKLNVLCNFRYNTEYTAEQLMAKLEAVLKDADLDYQCQWQLSGAPFLTQHGAMTRAISHAVQSATGTTPELSTGGGTSDGRFIAPWSADHNVEVVELGPVNATIHKIDESTLVADLGPLAEIYCATISELLG